jgi:Bacterial Ig-like domain
VRRLLLLAGALVIPVFPLFAAAPAEAADTVICVPVMVAGCTQSAATLPAAISAASTNGVSYTIRLASGTYSGTFQIDGTNHPITLQGAGQGATILTAPANVNGQTYLFAGQATVRDLTVQMTSVDSDGDIGLSMSHALVDHVTVDGSAVVNARGGSAGISTITNSVFLTPPTSGPGSTALSSSGGNTISDTSLTGSVGLNLSDPGTVDNVSRVSIRADSNGVTTDGGTVNIDDAVIDLGSGMGATGLGAVNFNNGVAPKTVNANHVTVIGGGPGSRGAWAYAAPDGVKTTSMVTLTNSIVRGSETSLVADANNDGTHMGPSTGIVTVSYSDYQTTGGVIGPNGAGGVQVGAGNVIDIDPAFVGAGNYHLTLGSPVVDKGDPAAGGPSLDRDGTARVIDGDAVPGARRDMGAYELHDSIAPDTAITSGPAGATNDATPTFTFTSEPGAAFQCKVDAGTFTACTSPFTTPSLANGVHAVAVRATDAASNVDATPATRSFTVDTTAPDTTITTKPAKRITKKKVKLAFSSEAGASFQCQVDGKAWRACTSPLKLKVKAGKHVVLVRAVDVAGNADATPAKVKFKRVPKPA